MASAKEFRPPAPPDCQSEVAKAGKDTRDTSHQWDRSGLCCNWLSLLVRTRPTTSL